MSALRWWGDARGLECLTRIKTQRTLAVVGARRADALGLRWATEIAESAQHQGVILISGDARGIDERSHRAICERGGESLAVLGCGLDHLTTRQRALSGLGVGLITRFESHQSAQRWTFPKRNAHIAMLADALIVVQADAKSGALSAARAALKLGRPVWALPNLPTHPLHRGCLSLIAEGARPLLSPEGWIELGQGAERIKVNLNTTNGHDEGHQSSRGRSLTEPRASGSSTPPAPDMPTHDSPLWSVTTDTPRALSTLAMEAQLKYTDALTEATLLELEGWLIHELGGLYRRGYGSLT